MLATGAIDRKSCFAPGIHAAGDIVDMTIAQICQGFGCNVTAMPGLTIDHDMIVRLHTQLAVPGLDLTEVDIEIRPRNHPCPMLFWCPDINEHESFFLRCPGLRQTGLQLLDGEQIRMVRPHGSGH